MLKVEVYRDPISSNAATAANPDTTNNPLISVVLFVSLNGSRDVTVRYSIDDEAL